MTRRKDGWFELVRLFYPGAYSFKITRDKTWKESWGKGGEEGKALPGGKDILFSVPDAGYYGLRFDPAGKRVAMEKVSPPAPVAMVKHEAHYYLTGDIHLDASASFAREGRTLSRYTWRQSESNPQRVCNCQLEDKSAPSLKVFKTGGYEFFLTVDDGEKGIPFRVYFEVVNRYSLVMDSRFTNLLEYKGDGKHETLLPPALAGERRFKLLMNGNTVVQDAITRELPKGRYTLFTYDSRHDDFNISSGTYARFDFNRKDYAGLEGRSLLSVAVAGNFNNWSTAASVMKKVNQDEYVLYQPLPEGVYQYKFVLDGKEWVFDKKSDETLKQPDGHGGFNSGVHVGDSGSLYGPPVREGIREAACVHDPGSIRYFNRMDDRTAEIRLRVLANDAEKVWLVTGGPAKKLIELEKRISSFGFDYYGTVLETAPEKGSPEYFFLLEEGKKRFYLADGYFSEKEPEGKKYFRPAGEVVFPVPAWAKGILWYQIMLDRFRNGDTMNDPECAIPWDWEWEKKYSCEKWDEKRFKDKQAGFFGEHGVWGRFFGGDIRGLTEKLGYLKELGVSGIYLNPVFESPSYHKYDTADYRHIDDHFGFAGDNRNLKETPDPGTWKWTRTDRLFLDLVKKAHALNIRIILDGVFNHSGDRFWAFEDLKKKKEKSVYRDWFVVTGWDPFRYEGWFGFSGLPVFRETADGLDPSVEDHIFNITRRWMDPDANGDPSDGIDGWRLDVANEVPHGFWKKWRKLVKSINKDAFITGEIWEKAAPWLAGDEFDSVMNYEFAKTAYRFFINTSPGYRLLPAQFDRALKEALDAYPLQVNLALQNLFGSHDTERVLSAIKNPDRDYDAKNRLQDGDDQYDTSRPGEREVLIYKLMLLFQFTFPGSPMIYYGDEAGMWGADDPEDRKPMFWPDINGAHRNSSLIDYVKKLGVIRSSHRALRLGSFATLLADDQKQVYGFIRADGGETLYIILNNSLTGQSVRIRTDAKALKDLLNEREILSDRGGAGLTLGPKSGAILLCGSRE